MTTLKVTPIYYNFPIAILDGFLDDPHDLFDKILAWVTYDKIKKITYVEGVKRVKPAIEDLDYCYNGDLYQWYHTCGDVYSQYKGARVGISRQQYFELRDSFSTMPELDKVMWLAFLAAKSIAGNKVYCKTNDLMLFARMNGRSKAFASEEDLKEHSHPVIASFYTRRKRETIRRRLVEEFHIVTYSNNDRGYYASTKLSLEKLIEAVEYNRHSTIRSSNAKMRVTRDRVLAKLGKKPP